MNDKFRNSWSLSLLLMVGLIVTALLTWRFLQSSFLPLLLLPVTLLGMYYLKSLPRSGRWAYNVFLLIVIVLFGWSLFQSIKSNVDNPREWDFVGFWLHGTTAVQHHNFYVPLYAQQLSRNMNLSDEFQQEIINVGFWYPPPTMFLFVPLGWFNLHDVMLVWNIFQVLFMVLCVVLLWRTFIRQTGLTGLLFVIALLLSFQPTSGTFFYAQTNFIALLWFILFWRDRNQPRGGIWFALAVITKPYLAFIGLYLLLRGRWRSLLAAAGMVLALCFLSILVFGTDIFFSYFTSSPMSRLPTFVYNEAGNQSLMALILRITQYDITLHSPYSSPIFLIMASILVGFTSWLIYKLDAHYSELGILLALVLALLIYPAIGNHYLVHFMVLFLLLWVNIDKLPGKQWSTTIFLTFMYVLLSKTTGLSTFVGIVVTWLTLVAIILWIDREKLLLSQRFKGEHNLGVLIHR